MKATATTEALNPHCEPQWPHNLDQSGWASRLQEAASGASTLFRLIHADLNLAEARAWDDNPKTLPAPFTADIAFGLRMAPCGFVWVKSKPSRRRWKAWTFSQSRARDSGARGKLTARI